MRVRAIGSNKIFYVCFVEKKMNKGKEQVSESTHSMERKAKERVDRIVMEVSKEMRNRRGFVAQSSSHSCEGLEGDTATSAGDVLKIMIEEKEKKIQKLTREVEYLKSKKRIEPSRKMFTPLFVCKFCEADHEEGDCYWEQIGACGMCGKYGHWTKDCPKWKKAWPNRQMIDISAKRPRGQELRGKRSMFDLRKPNPNTCQNYGKDHGNQRGHKLATICFKCGEPGHIVRDCPQ